MVERLAKMEGVVKEFSRSKISTPPSNDEAEPNVHISPMLGGTSPSPLSDPSSAAAQVSVNCQPALTGFEPPITHNQTTFVDGDIEVEYTGMEPSPTSSIKLMSRSVFDIFTPRYPMDQ